MLNQIKEKEKILKNRRKLKMDEEETKFNREILTEIKAISK